MAPTPRLAAAVAVAAPLWLLIDTPVGAWPALLANAALLAAAIWDAASLAPESAIDVQRVIPPVIGLGDPGQAVIEFRSRWPRTLRGALADRLPAGLRRPGPLRLPVLIASGQTTRVEFSLLGQARGVAHPGPIAVRVVGPLGLIARTLRWSPGDSVLVAPSLAGVRKYRLLALQHRLRDIGVRAVRHRGESTTLDRLREYVRGDDPRHIDWKVSARRGTLITREYAVEQGQTVLLAIDCGRMMTQIAGEHPRLEYALASALMLADVAAAGNDRIGVIAFDDDVRKWVPPARGPAAVRAVRDALIPLEARLVEPDYGRAFRMIASRQRKRSLIILFTDVVDARASQPLIGHLARASSSHLPVVVALRNAAIAAAAEGRAMAGGAAHSLWERSAAEELIGERETALAALRRRGIAVLDVEPHAMTAAVINRYLEVKARGAL